MSDTTEMQYPADPCLSRLASAIATRSGSLLDPESISFDAPIDDTITPDGINTKVTINGPGGSVDIGYNRRALSSLIERGRERFTVGFIPGQSKIDAIFQAIARQFKCLIAPIDCVTTHPTWIKRAPNGNYVIQLVAKETSYGWTGSVELVLIPEISFLSENVVSGLSGLVYP